MTCKKTFPARKHCQQKNNCQQRHCLQKNISSKKTLPAKNFAGRKSLPANIEFSVWKNGLLAQNPWNMGEQKWPILPAMETHKKCKNAAKATFALQQSFCPAFFIEIVHRSPTKDKPCQPMSSFKNKILKYLTGRGFNRKAGTSCWERISWDDETSCWEISGGPDIGQQTLLGWQPESRQVATPIKHYLGNYFSFRNIIGQ